MAKNLKLTPQIYLRGSGEQLEVMFAGKWELLKDLTEIDTDNAIDLCQGLGKLWTFMPTSDEQFKAIKLPKLFMKKNYDLSEEIVFYGGSFNPWHEGHRACLDLCPCSNIIVIPDYNPWKQKNEGNCWQKYIELCKKLECTSYSIFPGFLGLSDPNPTIEWLPKVKIQKKSLLIGEDNFMKFHEWKDYKQLLGSLHKLYVAPRLGHEEQRELQRKKLTQASGLTGIEILEPHPYEELSSSSLRK